MNKKTYIIGGLLVFVILIGAVYILLKPNQKEEDKSNPKEPENSVKLKSIDSNSGKIVQKFDVTIGGKKNEFKIEYSSEKKEDYATVLGKIPGSNNEFSINSTDENIDDFLGNNFNERKVHDYITEDDFKFIKGEDDKTYLLFILKTEHFVAGYADYLYVYNDDLKRVEGDVDYNGCLNDEAFSIRQRVSGHFSKEEPGKSGYEDTENFLGYKNVKDSYLNVKIEGNKIYYLKAIQNLVGEGDYGTLEERVYTIKNSKLEYTVKNKFKIIEAAGMAC